MEVAIGFAALVAYGLGGAFTCGLFGCKGTDEDAWTFFTWPLVISGCALIWAAAQLFTGAYALGKFAAHLAGRERAQ